MPAGSASVAASASTGTASSSSVGSPGGVQRLEEADEGRPGGLHARGGETVEELGEGAVDGGLDGAGDLAAQAEVGLSGPL